VSRQSFEDARCVEGVLGRVAHLRRDTPPRWGRLSANQMLCHLSDSYGAALGERAVSPAGPPRRIVKWIALNLPVSWPRNLQTRPEVDPFSGGTKPSEFECDRRTLVSLIRQFVEAEAGQLAPKHPIFGEMSVPDWLRWGYLHADHHLRQFGL
jgi:hypothetical protein